METTNPEKGPEGQAQPFDSAEIREGLRENVPPPMREAYDKVVTAGMKIMFDPKTHNMMVEQMQAEGPIDDRLSEGVASLMSIMLKNSKGAFPQQLIIPAGVELMLHAADFAAQGAGEHIDANEMASAMQKFVFKLFEGAGVKPELLMAGIGKMRELNAQPQGGPPQGEQQMPQGQMPPGGQQGAGGLLSQPMGAA